MTCLAEQRGTSLGCNLDAGTAVTLVVSRGPQIAEPDPITDTADPVATDPLLSDEAETSP